LQEITGRGLRFERSRHYFPFRAANNIGLLVFQTALAAYDWPGCAAINWQVNAQSCPEGDGDLTPLNDVLRGFFHIAIDFTRRRIHNVLAEKIGAALNPSMHQKPN
jgi:hypothetical protein